MSLHSPALTPEAHLSSGTGTRPRDAKGDKRARILEAAVRVFASKSFYTATVAEIAREAGIADGTIYLYFKSKDDLLISWFEWRMEQVVADLEKAIAGVDTAAARLEAFITAHLEMVEANPAAAEVLTVELRQSTKFMKEYSNPRFADFLRLLAGVIRDGQNAGELDPEVPAPLVARAIFGAIDELALAWLLGGADKFDIVRAAGWATRILLTGLNATSQRSNS
jgi:TetR/AcrR family transcriptional regulator, fatty acid metabolism regulator protein